GGFSYVRREHDLARARGCRGKNTFLLSVAKPSKEWQNLQVVAAATKSSSKHLLGIANLSFPREKHEDISRRLTKKLCNCPSYTLIKIELPAGRPVRVDFVCGSRISERSIAHLNRVGSARNLDYGGGISRYRVRKVLGE